MKPEFRRVRQTIYALKRAYPQAVTLCRTTGNSTNLETGLKAETLIKLIVKRAILLPAKNLREFAYDLSFIAANKEFTYGGFYDHKLRLVLIDRRDVVDFTIDNNMHAMISGRRYEVKQFAEYEEQEVLALLLDSLSSASLLDQIAAPATDTLVVTDEVDDELQ